jgi:hypothetical protein
VLYGRAQPVGEESNGCSDVKSLKKPADNTYNDREQHTKNDHGCNGKIKAEVFFFNPYIAGQMADPVQLIVKKVNNKAYNHYSASNHHNILTGVGIHKKFILIHA